MKNLKVKLNFCKTGFLILTSVAITVTTSFLPVTKSFSGTAEFTEAMRALGAVKAMNNVQPIMLNPVNKVKINKVYLEVYDSREWECPLTLSEQNLKKNLCKCDIQ